MQPGFQQITVTPPAGGLAYSHLIPDGWQQIPLPEDVPDFSEPVFMALGVCMAPYGAVVLSVGARPAFEDGSVIEWLQYMCRQEQFEVRSLMPVRIGETPACAADAVQQTEAGPMTIRLILFEDGGRLISVSAMAPAQVWDSLAAVFEAMIESFRLVEPRGATAPLVPGYIPA